MSLSGERRLGPINHDAPVARQEQFHQNSFIRTISLLSSLVTSTSDEIVKGFTASYRQGTRRMRTAIPKSGSGNKSEEIGEAKLQPTLPEARIPMSLKSPRRTVMEIFKKHLEHIFTSVDDCPFRE